MKEDCDNRGGACLSMRNTGQCGCLPGPKYVLWDPRDGDPKRKDDGEFTSDGLIGRLDQNNVYLTAYPEWPGGAVPLSELEVGQCIRGVRYRLSGSAGTYDIYRVK